MQFCILNFELNTIRRLICFQAAALKQVPSCKFYPLEAVKTNVLGTENVLNAALAKGVNGLLPSVEI
ncbi:MAG TPA: polysaccharide biosynthesis protein [Desulfuromonadaceae bacterium]